MKTKILKPILFLAILARTDGCAWPGVPPEKSSGTESAERAGEVDYLVVGDSEGWASFQPMEVGAQTDLRAIT